MSKPVINSKLPHVGTTIFAIMSKMATDYNAINLSQGFPNFPASSELISIVEKYMRKGFNQYAPMPGVKELREAISDKAEKLYGISYHPETEVTVTSGGTEALFSAISAVVEKGDEVIVFEPAYDSYVPAIELNGGIPIYISLCPPHYKIDWEIVKQKISSKTKLIIVNTPHNPTGAVLSAEDLKQLANMVRNTNIFLIADEVYEHIIFDDLKHHSFMTHPVLQERSFIIGSFGKTFHVTGWKIGFCVAPVALTTEFRKIHQFLTFASITPVQYALAEFMKNPDNYLEVPAFYEQKRNKFLDAVKNSKFTFQPSSGSYFQNLSYKNISNENDFDLAVRLTKEIGVASIPVSVFYHDKTDHKILRFCFAKDDATLELAGEKLCGL
ncbi:MAG: methionine aminotransferase [Bacteroidetes bacterium RIFOXYA12_FULL_35_11]|nr:MAG: methionine aminotransferase [Bacteroidetes bacterium GWF2_35_48]OFY74898.1 MAG: methionine aminotransferase [Bacteroidetes bacterium RIFOXYA12_FULL_35_11]OFY95708.1 MAG: methionine aminotransferase [Bacteroidetes bacterium RIFOXYC12_FULL_35_7]HBX49573.1 methionine aminotransferase [Bacteroidales bacterium]